MKNENRAVALVTAIRTNIERYSVTYSYDVQFDEYTPPNFTVGAHLYAAPVDQEAEIVELKAALTLIMRAAEGAKVNCGSDPESPDAIRNAALASIAAVAAQGLGLLKGPKLSEGV